MYSLPSIKAICALASFLPLVWCATYSVEVCTTSNGPKSIKSVGTTTKYATIHQTVGCTQTVTPTSTIQPKPTTITATSTIITTITTTLPNANINTFTSTTTAVSTTTTTDLITASASTSITVTITVAPTTTIPTSPGFIPASSAPGLRKRDLEHRARALAGSRPDLLRQKMKRNDAQCYPNSVTCGVLVDIVTTNSKTITASKTATVTGKPSTATSVSKTTQTIISSIVGGISASTTVTATNTITATATAFSTTTITSTGTATLTVSAALQTFYAACDTNNLLDNDPYDNGNLNIATFNVNNYGSFVTNSAYDCCVACITSPINCGGTVFFNDGSGTCQLGYTQGTCDQSFIILDVAGNRNGDPALYTVSDGYCGQVEGT